VEFSSNPPYVFMTLYLTLYGTVDSTCCPHTVYLVLTTNSPVRYQLVVCMYVIYANFGLLVRICMCSNNRMILDDELERVWWEVIAACFYIRIIPAFATRD
jgi:hypothetical protein